MKEIPGAGTLLRQTQMLVHLDSRSLPKIYADIVAAGIEDITYFWLRKLSSGEVRDPSVNKVQALYEFLSGKPLQF